MSVKVELDVVGIASTLRALNKIDPELAKAARRQIKEAANPLVQNARRFVPSRAPLSGMANSGRLQWSTRARSSIRAQQSVARRKVGRTRRIDLIKVVQSSASGAMFDMAGRATAGKTPAGINMIQVLNSRYGRPSRSMWRDNQAAARITEKKLLEAVAELSAVINKIVGKE